MLVILLCGVILFTKSLAQLPDNPCSSIFQYRYNNSVIYGEIIIPYDGSKEMYLTVNVSTVGLHKNAVSTKLLQHIFNYLYKMLRNIVRLTKIFIII